MNLNYVLLINSGVLEQKTISILEYIWYQTDEKF